jgi:hypothetical protein
MLLKLITACANETYNKAWIDRHLSHIFPIKNGPQEGDALSLLLLNSALEYAIRTVQTNQEGMK